MNSGKGVASAEATKSDQMLGRLKALLIVCLLVYIAYLTAQLSWQLIQPPGTKVLALSEMKIAKASGDRARGAQLPELNLFGKVGARVLPSSNQAKVAPKTRLRLVLKGVFTEDQGGASGAIIEEIGRSTEYYRIGDKVPGNATLEEVYSDRVLIRRAGKLETLAFDDVVSAGSSIAKVKRQRTSEQDLDTPEKFIAEATKRLSDDPEKALSSVGLAPSDGGGYVYQGNNPMLSGMNLEKGDVIMSVNGHSLGDVQRDRELMKSLYEQGSVEVEVVRGGASFFVNYPLR